MIGVPLGFPRRPTLVVRMLSLLGTPLSTVPAPARYFTNLVDHGAAASVTFQQRYYRNDTAFRGPGSPIICIIGGEGGVPPSLGFFYPWVVYDLASKFGALVLQPEHRFYGESQPFATDPSSAEHLRLLTPDQALQDAMALIRATQRERNCSLERGDAAYCPVITIGGSYPGFLSAMARLRYPAVVDGAYAAAAPLRHCCGTCLLLLLRSKCPTTTSTMQWCSARPNGPFAGARPPCGLRSTSSPPPPATPPSPN